MNNRPLTDAEPAIFQQVHDRSITARSKSVEARSVEEPKRISVGASR